MSSFLNKVAVEVSARFREQNCTVEVSARFREQNCTVEVSARFREKNRMVKVSARFREQNHTVEISARVCEWGPLHGPRRGFGEISRVESYGLRTTALCYLLSHKEVFFLRSICPKMGKCSSKIHAESGEIARPTTLLP